MQHLQNDVVGSYHRPPTACMYQCRASVRHEKIRAGACTDTESKPCSQRQGLSRRAVLQRSAVLLLLSPAAVQAQEVWQQASATSVLPKGYEDVSSKLVRALKESIDVDLSDAEEREVRRKADPAKGLVREWLIKWKDNQAVQGEQSYKEISATLQELGQFYIKNGMRARLPSSLGKSLVAKLDAAESSLPSTDRARV